MTILQSVWSSRAWLLSTVSHDALAWSRCWHQEPAFRQAVLEACGALLHLQVQAFTMGRRFGQAKARLETEALLG